jgi:hypothetical protein
VAVEEVSALQDKVGRSLIHEPDEGVRCGKRWLGRNAPGRPCRIAIATSHSQADRGFQPQPHILVRITGLVYQGEALPPSVWQTVFPLPESVP